MPYHHLKGESPRKGLSSAKRKVFAMDDEKLYINGMLEFTQQKALFDTGDQGSVPSSVM